MLQYFQFLRSGQHLETYFFAVPRLCLTLMGFWPESLQVRAFIHFVILAVGVFTELHAGILCVLRNEIEQALETFCPMGTSAVTLLKMFLILRHHCALDQVVAELRQLLFTNSLHLNNNDTTTTVKQSIMRQYSMLSVRLSFWSISVAFFTCTVYNLKPILLWLLFRETDQQFIWTTPFNMTLPKFIMQAPYFPISYIFTAYTGYVTIFMFSGSDTFYFEFCAHITALINVLQIEGEEIFHPYDDQLYLNNLESKRIERLLVALVKRHNKIINLVGYFRQRYTVITLAHFLSASTVIGISAIDLLTASSSGLGAILYIAYTIAALSQMFVYCYGGTLVAESSVEFGRVLGTCPWYLCRPRQRRYILLLILRSQRAISMTVPFLPPSLPTFASILQTSGSFIALAKSFQ